MKNPLTLTPNEQRILDAAWEEAINQGHIPADTNVSNEVVLTPVTNRERTEQPRPYNMDQPTTSSAMETGWLSKRTHPPQQREEKLYTFIYRGPPPHFDIHTRTNCIYVDHTDHYHFVFQCCPQNKQRTIQRIIAAGNLPRDSAFHIMTTVQPVLHWDNFAAYLVRKDLHTVYIVGTKLQHLHHNLISVTREEKDCTLLAREERATRQRMDTVKRNQRIDLIDSIIETNDCKSFNEFENCLSRKERKQIYAEFGNVWQETAKLCVHAYLEEKRKIQESTSFAEYIQQNNHEETCTHPTDTTKGEQWLDKLLLVNNIDKTEFLQQLLCIMNKAIDRLNAFVIEGPTTTGKSLLLNLVCANYLYGTVQRSGDHSQFFLQNLLNKSVALMEEPRITPITVNDFKELLGGQPFDIHVKHQEDVRLKRIPVLISTNTNICTYISATDANAIKARCYINHFIVPVGSDLLPAPPYRLCACHFTKWFTNWLLR